MSWVILYVKFEIDGLPLSFVNSCICIVADALCSDSEDLEMLILTDVLKDQNEEVNQDSYRLLEGKGELSSIGSKVWCAFTRTECQCLMKKLMSF